MSDQPRQRPTLPSQEEIAALPADGGSRFNRLIFESSPYLLQHAANPVDWYPWGEAAFAEARRRDVPVFLSIGYATCHWCHVMEHQSFEDEEVAARLNEVFVCIKVDKEERPDIDDIYMTACLAMNGHGGWPLTALLTHDRKPFFTGTYFPKHGVGQRPGMMELTPRVAEFWKENREDVETNAEQLTRYVAGQSSAEHAELDGIDMLQRAAEQLESAYDPRNGGFSGAPKFPTPHNFSTLLRHWRRSGAEKSRDMCLTTLHHMRRGGVFDHVGFGFHRYATDPFWLLPHFEKMLYDQALMAIACCEAHAASGDTALCQVAHEIFAYVLRDMTAPEGGFYSAEDADSEGVEGKFYVWSPSEIVAVLGEADGALFNRVFNIVPEGNFREEATGRKTGDNIPHLIKTWPELAAELELDEADLRSRMEACRQKLFDHRETRIHPLKDDKVLTDWNGLMIAALAMGARYLQTPKYAEAARRAADFLLTHLRDEHGRLLKRWRLGDAGLPAHLDDYAFVVWGLLELYRATFETRYLAEALALTETTLHHFRGDNGGFFLTADDGEELIVRSQKIYDGALPSGNSVMICNLAALSRLTGRMELDQAARETAAAFGQSLRTGPSGHNLAICGFDFLAGGSREIVIAGARDAADTQALIERVNQGFRPFEVVLLHDPDDAALADLAPFAAGQKPIDGKATAYVCEQFSCRAPVTEPEDLAAQLG